ncbi:MAG TPA: hypothetical protein P5543_08165 [Planctomycetota bacterium]|nr:hypothetical protein [Planctomycetota bacterium]HRU52150.1 hypothetical protein [Planctomycetota bacterium]
MDIDFQKHGFYFILLGILLGYILIYFLVVGGTKNQLNSDTKKLNSISSNIRGYKNRINDLPSQKMIQAHENHKKELTSTLNEVLDIYQQQDVPMERWFPEIRISSTSQFPQVDEFAALYDRERSALIEKYIDKKQGLKLIAKKSSGISFGDEIDIDVKERITEIEGILNLTSKKEIVIPDSTKNVQKKFFIVQEVLDLLEKGKLQSLSSFRFINDWNEKIDELFFKRTIEITGKIDYKNIPLLVQTILNASSSIKRSSQIKKEAENEADKNTETAQEKTTVAETTNQPIEEKQEDSQSMPLMTEISYLTIKRDITYIPETIEIDVAWNESEEQAREKYYSDTATNVVLPSVEITMRIDILDYDEKIKNIESQTSDSF